MGHSISTWISLYYHCYFPCYANRICEISLGHIYNCQALIIFVFWQTFVSADLMDCVFRMKYKELYFLKKVLKETGQKILAKAVIVRLKDGSELAYGNV